MTQAASSSAAQLPARRDDLFYRYLEEMRSAEAPVIPHWIDGEEVFDGELHWREDPSRPEKVASGYHAGTTALVDAALAAARRETHDWEGVGVARRAEMFRRALPLLDEDRIASISATIALETGKSCHEAFVETEELFVLIDRYTEAVLEHESSIDPLEPGNPKVRSESLLRAYGVFGVVAPFNYPLTLGAGPATAALLAGNTVVIKPPHLGPRSAFEFVTLMRECGLPAGVLNMVQGGDEAGKALVAGDVDGISFTGSYDAGMAIFRAMQSGPYPRPVIAEMGGSNPVVVTDSADLERAAEGILTSGFGLSGQRCSACSRVVVTEGAHDRLVDLLAEQAAEYVVGGPTDEKMMLGPLIEPRVVTRFEEAVEEGERDGRVVAGGKSLSEFGYAVEPTVIADLPLGHRLTREEFFMPLITVTKVSDFEEAVAEANNTDLGLTAGIYTNDPDEARSFLQRSEAGCVDVNVPGAATTGWWPGNQTFGGWKGSGSTGKQAFGRWYVQQFARERCQSIAADFEL